MRRKKSALFLFFSIFLIGFFNIELVSSLSVSQNISSYGTIVYGNVPSLQVLRAHGVDKLTRDQLDDVNLLATGLDMYRCTHHQGYKVSQLHEINPNLKILLYRNIRCIYDYADEWQMALDGGWLLRDSANNLIHNPDYPSIYIVDYGNLEYQQWVANWIKERLDEFGFDGVFTDNGFNAAYNAYWWDVGGQAYQPINPRTGTFWTIAEVQAALIGLHHKIRQAIGSKLNIANGIFDGDHFYDHQNNWENILNNCEIDGFMSEGIFTRWEPNTYYTETNWKQSVDFVSWIQNNWLTQPNRIYCPHTRCASDSIPASTSSLQMAKFSFTSLLLGVEKSQNYLSVQGAIMEDEIQNLFKLDLGVPKGDYYLVEGTHVYARDFTKIKVLVNPTDQTYSVNLSGNYEDLEGQTFNSIIIGPHTGLILKVT